MLFVDFPMYFLGVANYWVQEINAILPLLGFLGVNLQSLHANQTIPLKNSLICTQ